VTTFLLIRHAEHDLLGKALAGRMAGVYLNAAGQAQAQALPARLRSIPIQAIYCSPQIRTRETAEPLAKQLGLTISEEPQLDELDFGSWTGKPFSELEADPDWQHWNSRRSTSRAPGGESMLEAQHRTLAVIDHLEQHHRGETLALFSHCDTIKAALMGILHLSLDEFFRFEISPASISVVGHESGWPRVLQLNARESLRD
jgi:probable phosphoglycerate mutase